MDTGRVGGEALQLLTNSRRSGTGIGGATGGIGPGGGGEVDGMQMGAGGAARARLNPPNVAW